MASDLVTPFVQAGSEVLDQLAGVTAEQGEVVARTPLFATQAVSIILGVSGALKGQVIYGMSEATAAKLTSIMMGTPEAPFDGLTASAMGELGNIISGGAMALLFQAGYQCDLTQPTIVNGTGVDIATKTPAVVAPLETPYGRIDVNIALATA